jgi:hypothetical protein
MKKEKILELACIIASGILANPVMSNVCSPTNSVPRRHLLETLITEITAISKQTLEMVVEE